ncbi:4a-hydroxytetrahydrobiopterin dehydratase [Granulicella tundricola]|uniref:Putative pterin-4-alpha-carbinolamine dehydratase n=1 Tax=Granulicella tundricola (strain ATCC BAA-1859 / DSM 23138 / MP5ACTX9) TaxID=1198114 RepID=E8X2H0_GRATM|nr:4a-hydroxytetrahydrobiopterin dehydratase [Granulicella tundricola]ADW69194.1 transcriptional coactivator/pterin dehydratase [Granulicella tundricola MP5ACTX9]
MAVLSKAELDELLEKQQGWELQDGKLVREWRFRDFVEAMKFVDFVAEVAEEAGHHPDIDIRYNKVKLGLVTHDEGGISSKDADMAARLGARFDI